MGWNLYLSNLMKAGLLGAMDELGLRIEFYTPEEIKPIIEDMNLEESKFC